MTVIFGPPPGWEPPPEPKYAAQCVRCFLITFQDDRVCLPCRRNE